MHRLKQAEDEKKHARWSQSSSSSSWQWQANWWESDHEYSPQRWYDHWLHGVTRYSVARYSFAERVSTSREFRIFIVNKSVTADDSLLSPTVGVNTIHPAPEIHEHICVTKRLRNIVHDYKYILTFIERIVNNYVNGATHADKRTLQHWAHCMRSVVESSESIHIFTLAQGLSHVSSIVIPSMNMRIVVWAFSFFSPSTSCSISPSSFSCFSPWRTTTPWTWTPCATSPTGPSSPWTIACPTQKLRMLSSCVDRLQFLLPKSWERCHRVLTVILGLQFLLHLVENVVIVRWKWFWVCSFSCSKLRTLSSFVGSDFGFAVFLLPKVEKLFSCVDSDFGLAVSTWILPTYLPYCMCF